MAYSIDATQDRCYPGTTVLVNKMDIHDQEELSRAEKIIVSVHSIEIEQNPPVDPFTFDLYRTLHKELFGDVYDWAGELRTVNLSKKGTAFYRADALPQLGKAKFDYLQSRNEFRGLSHDELANEIAEFYHDINMLHSFREGNGRTQRLFFTLLIRRAGYEIDFWNCDTDELMIATIYAAQGVMDHLREFFDREIQAK